MFTQHLGGRSLFPRMAVEEEEVFAWKSFFAARSSLVLTFVALLLHFCLNGSTSASLEMEERNRASSQTPGQPPDAVHSNFVDALLLIRRHEKLISRTGSKPHPTLLQRMIFKRQVLLSEGRSSESLSSISSSSSSDPASSSTSESESESASLSQSSSDPSSSESSLSTSSEESSLSSSDEQSPTSGPVTDQSSPTPGTTQDATAPTTTTDSTAQGQSVTTTTLPGTQSTSPSSTTTCMPVESCQNVSSLSLDTQMAFDSVFQALIVAATMNIAEVVRELETPAAAGDLCAGPVDIGPGQRISTNLIRGGEELQLEVISTTASELDIQQATYTTQATGALGEFQLVFPFILGAAGAPVRRFRPPGASEFLDYPPMRQVCKFLYPLQE